MRLTPSLDWNVGDAAHELERALEADAALQRILALNIGGKHPEAQARRLLARENVDCLELDVVPGDATDLVADPANLPLPSGMFDLVVADAILEHVPDPDRVAAEIHRVLTPNGIVLSDVPFLLPVHGGAFDFLRFSPLAHRRLFRHFAQEAAGISSGPGAALAHSCQQFLLSFSSSRSFRYGVKLLCRLGLFWLKYFDLYLASKPSATDGALGSYFIGRKSDYAISDPELMNTYSGGTPNLFAD